METSVTNLLGGWTVKDVDTIPHFLSCILYFICAGVLSLIIRVLLALLKSFEREKDIGLLERFCSVFGGFSSDYNVKDYWCSFLIGWGEICIFPVLIKTGNWLLIGGWVASKMLPQKWTPKFGPTGKLDFSGFAGREKAAEP